MLTVIVAGRNDDYGRDFRARLFRTALHNSALLDRAEVPFEYMLAEWNPLTDRPPLAEEFVERVPNARAVIIPAGIHKQYSLNPHMPFHEMAAKNAALRRARGDVVIITNADILFDEELVHTIAAGGWRPDTLYRAHRIDVNPDLSWRDIQLPVNQLGSGEGTLCPPYYLGAGGDFCLAVRQLWHSVGGFNERIRFSTRAKDWQFFLSAAAQGIGIEFIGNVYHLDHEGGLRNTSPSEHNTDTVHFGKWWDIEFGLPVSNGEHWGFSRVGEHRLRDEGEIVVLESNDYVVPEEQNLHDRNMLPWLTRPAGSPDTAAALLFHAICAAHRNERRLICRITDPRLAVALTGFVAVAERAGVEIRCNWTWPSMPGYTIAPFEPEPRALKHDDWVLEETDRGLHVREHGSWSPIDVLPQRLPVRGPAFNPVLARRLLLAWLRLQETRTDKIAICGAGSHTRELLTWGVPDQIDLVGIVESDRLPSNDVAVLLSSASFESDMLEACRKHGNSNVIALYADWPSDIWTRRSRSLHEVLA